MVNVIKYIGTRRIRLRILPVVRVLFFLAGRSWNSFYSWMLNLQERNTTLDMILSEPKKNTGRGLFAWWLGIDHFLFMKRNGLKSSHKVLDFGCGYGRTAIPLIKYLDDGNYVGTELSSKRIALAKEWVGRENLKACNPIFFVSLDNSMLFLEDKSFDVIWTLSVFTHMPEKEMKEVLAAFHRILKKNGAVYFHYNSPNSTKPISGPTVKDFFWEDAFIEKTISEHGYKLHVCDDWVDELDRKIGMRSNMLKLTKISS